VRRLRVGVFCGGQSAEHEVSIASAEAVLRHIDRDRFEPYLVYIDRHGRWHLPAAPAPRPEGALSAELGAASVAEEARRLRGRATAGGSSSAQRHGSLVAAQPVVGEAPVVARAAIRGLSETIDVAFLVAHGPFGEDGTLQGFLELAGIPYIGAGVLASALAMDKVVFKDLMRGHDIPVVDYLWFKRSAWQTDGAAVAAAIAARFARCVVKPARLGSSVGMSLVHGPDELPDALEEAFRYDSKVIVEAYVEGARELECGVIGNDEPIVFEPGEVRSHNEWYDYESKYVDGLADVVPRAEVDPTLARRVRELALRAYRAVDCRGFARVDFLVPQGAVYLSEMNTLPGFTTTSMFPKQAELAGLAFPELIARLIELGLEAWRERHDDVESPA
jgi:D-alanine-D-alanine ligase